MVLSFIILVIFAFLLGRHNVISRKLARFTVRGTFNLSLILIENVVLLRGATIKNALYELQCVQLFIIFGVRDALVVL